MDSTVYPWNLLTIVVFRLRLTGKYDGYNILDILFLIVVMATLSKREQTRARILDVAARAVRRDGFAGVGVADVMKGAGLTHGGFYAHFPSRDALLADALVHAGDASAAHLARRAAPLIAAGASPLVALVSSYLSDEHLTACEAGCVVGALGADLARQADALRVVARERVDRLVQTVEAALLASGDDSDPLHGRALALSGAMAGLLQIARTLGPGEAGSAALAAGRAALLAQYGK